jgi:hypothetical protein
MALLYECPRLATVAAIDTVKCVSLGRESLQLLLGSELQQVIYRNIFKIALEKDPELSKLTKLQHQNLVDRMTVHNFDAG